MSRVSVAKAVRALASERSKLRARASQYRNKPTERRFWASTIKAAAKADAYEALADRLSDLIAKMKGK